MPRAPHFTAIRNTLILMVFIDVAAFSIIFPIIPDLMEYYLTRIFAAGVDDLRRVTVAGISLSRDDVAVILGGLLTSIWAFLQFFSAPLWGRLSDKIGRKKILMLSATGLSLAHVLWGFATSLPVFFAYRMLGGIMGGHIGVAHAAMADITEKKDRTRYMGMLGAAAGSGMIIGPVMGGLLGHPAMQGVISDIPFFHPFSLCAFASALLFAVNALFLIRMPETRKNHRMDEAVEYTGLNLRLDVPIPGFRLLALLNFIYCFSLAGVELLLPYFYKQRYDLPPSSIGMVFLFIGSVMVAAQIMLIPFLLRHMSEKTMILAGFMIIPVPLALCVNVAPEMAYSLAYIFPVALGASVIGPAVMGTTSHLVPPDRQGHSLGILTSYGSLAYATGPLITSALYGATGLDSAAIISSCLFLLGAGLATRIGGTQKSSTA